MNFWQEANEFISFNEAKFFKQLCFFLSRKIHLFFFYSTLSIFQSQKKYKRLQSRSLSHQHNILHKNRSNKAKGISFKFEIFFPNHLLCSWLSNNNFIILDLTLLTSNSKTKIQSKNTLKRVWSAKHNPKLV